MMASRVRPGRQEGSSAEVTSLIARPPMAWPIPRGILPLGLGCQSRPYGGCEGKGVLAERGSSCAAHAGS